MLYQSDQKAIELRRRACKLFKTHAPNEVPSHKKNLRQLGIQREKKKKEKKKDGALLIIESGNGSAG